MTREAGKIHPAALRYAGELRAGTMDRREFLARATALGLSAPAAWGLAGRAVALHLAEARDGGVAKATQFAASEAAARAYMRLGFHRTGSFALALLPYAQKVTP